MPMCKQFFTTNISDNNNFQISVANQKSILGGVTRLQAE